MRFRPCELAGAFIIEPEPVADERGLFARLFSRREFERLALATEFVQSSISFSPRRGTLRGLHLQIAPREEVKLVRCTSGAIFDVIIDLRPHSPTRRRWTSVELSAENRLTLYVPRGFAHGFQTLTDNAEVCYQMSEIHSPEHARGIAWNDPTLAIRWPLPVSLISKHDQELPTLEELAVNEHNGAALLRALKAAARRIQPTLCIPVGRPPHAYLRPAATKPELLDRDDVTRLTEWRNRFPRAFLTEFHATQDRTARWLTEVIGPDDSRILFMIDDLAGNTFGHMGLHRIDFAALSAHVDNVVRGLSCPRGMMSASLLAMIAWARAQLGLSHFELRVISDNPAVEFYRRLGFQEMRRIALRRTQEADTIRWVEDQSLSGADRMLLHMVLAPPQT